MVTTRSQRYLDKAAEFDRLAAGTCDEESRRQFTGLANEWRDLANDAAHMERIGRDRPD